MKRIAAAGIGLTLSLCGVALGHPGHETVAPAGSPLHYVVEPVHVATTVAAVALMFAAWRLVVWAARRTDPDTQTRRDR
ncbi:MAG: hypothetical protein GC159_03395 [Phycisphaera sp.]|nr:hypothetical protein [Phycisphaera sp.]